MTVRVVLPCCRTLLTGAVLLGASSLAGAEAAPAVSVEIREDYDPGRYRGPLQPSPPHADGNPRRAVIVRWRDRAPQLVFSHEASYCPFLELPGGGAMSNPFFEVTWARRS